jgi:hypothetical protein
MAEDVQRVLFHKTATCGEAPIFVLCFLLLAFCSPLSVVCCLPSGPSALCSLLTTLCYAARINACASPHTNNHTLSLHSTPETIKELNKVEVNPRLLSPSVLVNSRALHFRLILQ